MSLIIAYVGKKGCVMAGDKRRIAYFGSKEERELLEQEIYSGEITSDEELYARAEELEISLKGKSVQEELWKPKEKGFTEQQMVSK